MTGTAELRTTLAGLLSFAAAEEQALLAATAFRPDHDRGSPDRWAAVPVVAHNNQFKGQQAERLGCVLGRRVPPAYDEIDHVSAEVYQGYLAQPPDAVLAEAIDANPDLRANARRDPDLRVLREASPG